MDVRYIFDTREIEVIDDYGFPTYTSIDSLELVDANERAYGTEHEYIMEDGLHVVFYPEGHLIDWFYDKY